MKMSQKSRATQTQTGQHKYVQTFLQVQDKATQCSLIGHATDDPVSSDSEEEMDTLDPDWFPNEGCTEVDSDDEAEDQTEMYVFHNMCIRY